MLTAKAKIKADAAKGFICIRGAQGCRRRVYHTIKKLEIQVFKYRLSLRAELLGCCPTSDAAFSFCPFLKPQGCPLSFCCYWTTGSASPPARPSRVPLHNTGGNWEVMAICSILSSFHLLLKVLPSLSGLRFQRVRRFNSKIVRRVRSVSPSSFCLSSFNSLQVRADAHRQRSFPHRRAEILVDLCKGQDSD